MVFNTKCKKCSQFSESFGNFCNMECSVKGKEKMFPSKFTMRDIANCLENNIGIKISTPNMSIYVKEINLIIQK